MHKPQRYLAMKFRQQPTTPLTDKAGVWAVWDVWSKGWVLCGGFAACTEFVMAHNAPYEAP